MGKWNSGQVPPVNFNAEDAEDAEDRGEKPKNIGSLREKSELSLILKRTKSLGHEFHE